MIEAPTGTLTLLFSDIEGSTRLLQRAGVAYEELLGDHRRLLRTVFEAHGGYEVETEGDGFFVVFASANDAVAAAAEAQRALAAHSWPEGQRVRVRMGLHTGHPKLVNGDYLGIDVHRAARVMSAGHGDQVLLSNTTVQLLSGVETIPLGEHRLKDLLQPERLHQLRIEGLPSEFPPLKTLGSMPNNLPVEPNQMIGRERELAEVCELLRRDDVHLVTLTGTAGTGKTRLALQAGAELLKHFENGVFFVPLAAVRDPELVVPTVAHQLAIREVPGEPLFTTVLTELSGKHMLLIVDNFEQITAAAPELAKLATAATGVTLLVTSRTRLHLTAERTFEVPPLGVPARDASPDDLLRNPAVALFLLRAQTAKPGFELTDDNASAVSEICIRLDGLPLALELAAARIAILTPRALQHRLDQRLALLVDGAQDADQRQRTLRSAIEWSYELLSSPEQTLFARLGVFAGGCRLAATESVCDSDGDLGVELLDALQELVEQNLLRQESDPDGEPRFGMLETIREFALERLKLAGELPALSLCHALYYADLAERKARVTHENADRLEPDRDNLRLALSTLATSDQAERGLQMATMLNWFWQIRGPIREAQSWLLAYGDRSDLSPQRRARALGDAAYFAIQQGDLTRAERLIDDAMALVRPLADNAKILALLLNTAGILAKAKGDLHAARTAFEEGLQLARTHLSPLNVAARLSNLSDIAILEGSFTEAADLARESVALTKSHGDEQGVCICSLNLAIATFYLGDLDTAEEVFRESGETALELDYAIGSNWSLAGLAAVAAKRGQAKRAVTLAAQLDTLITETEIPLEPAEQRLRDDALDRARSDLDPDSFRQAWADGAQMTREQALRYALSATAAISEAG